MQFYPLYIRRSDAKRFIKGKYGVKEPNEPTPEQLNSDPDANGISDFYREIPAGEMKEIDWRRKLGGMLIRELGGKEHRGNYILAALPEGYRLFEHVKCKTSEIEGKTQKLTKNHAGGGNERQDAYLYGHPQGRKKRYRSPADFFPHLLWLATDETGDPDNCSCKLCTPDELQIETQAKTKLEPVKKEEEASWKGEGKVMSNPAVVMPRRTSAQDVSKATVAPSPSPAPGQRPGSAGSHLSPSPLPQPRSHEQILDIQYAQFLFRPGEVVWFSRGQAWGLGLVVSRHLAKDSQQQDIRQYNVQPLSHPFGHPRIVMIIQDLLRPWLAWSAPQCTIQFLNSRNFTYESVDWQGVVTMRYGSGDPEVDGSILAAKAVDSSYTLFDQIPDAKRSESGIEETHWNGIYLGGEKIWVGEAVRLRLGTGTDIIVVHDIMERSRAQFSNNPPAVTTTVVGDVYAFVTAQHNPKQALPSAEHLPLPLREDLRYRNSISLSKTGTISFWRLIHSHASLNISELKGRWYSSSQLLPVLRGEQFPQDLAAGNINDAGLWMNGRGDSTPGFSGAGIRKNDRKEAFGRAVPENLKISRGLDDPQEELAAQTGNVDPMLIDEGQEGQHHDNAHLEIDQFMNLDGMEHDSMPGFGNQYGVQDGFYGGAG